MDGVDDLGAINPLQVDAGDPEVAMPQLPLDNDKRDPLVRHFDSMSVAELMRRKAPSHARGRGGTLQLLSGGGGSQCRPAVGPWITHRSAPTGSWARISSHGSNCDQAQRSIPTSRRSRLCLSGPGSRRWRGRDLSRTDRVPR